MACYIGGRRTGVWAAKGNAVWTLRTSKNIELIESVQCRAAQWIKSPFDPLILLWTKPNSECIKNLDDVPWNCKAIMLVLCCFMLYLTILLQLTQEKCHVNTDPFFHCIYTI